MVNSLAEIPDSFIEISFGVIAPSQSVQRIFIVRTIRVLCDNFVVLNSFCDVAYRGIEVVFRQPHLHFGVIRAFGVFPDEVLQAFCQQGLNGGFFIVRFYINKIIGGVIGIFGIVIIIKDDVELIFRFTEILLGFGRQFGYRHKPHLID